MLDELNQLLHYRRERENRAALALKRARANHKALEEAVVGVEAELQFNLGERQSRQSKLYKQSLHRHLTTQQVDDLNIELDLMAEQTDRLKDKLSHAHSKVTAAAEAVEEAVAVYQKCRKAGDRWNHLVDDVAEKVRIERELAEEFAIEDDLGDRQSSRVEGGW